MNIDFGLSVTYDGKSYTLMELDHIQEYPIGGLICEYCRLSPTEVKDVIMQCSDLDKPVNVESVTRTVLEFHEKLLETFPPVCGVMISLEFQNAAQDWMKAIRENCVEQLTSGFFARNENDQIQEFILADTSYTEFGCNTILQMMLSCYYAFSLNYVNTKYMFDHVLGKNGDSEQRENVLKAYSDFYGGLKAGINAGRSGVISAMRSAAQAAVSAAKSTLKIKSPSRVFRDEVGVMAMKGFGQGVMTESRAQAQIIRNAARYLTEEAREGAIVNHTTANQKTYNQSSNVTLTGNTFAIRDEQDIYALATEIAALTRRQQRGKGLRMA